MPPCACVPPPAPSAPSPKANMKSQASQKVRQGLGKRRCRALGMAMVSSVMPNMVPMARMKASVSRGTSWRRQPRRDAKRTEEMPAGDNGGVWGGL